MYIHSLLLGISSHDSRRTSISAASPNRSGNDSPTVFIRVARSCWVACTSIPDRDGVDGADGRDGRDGADDADGMKGVVGRGRWKEERSI